MLNSINTALHNVEESKPHRFSYLIPREIEKAAMYGESSGAPFWIRTLGVSMVRSRRASTSLADCPDEGFRSIETSMYWVSHRTTSNEPLRRVQQASRRKQFEARHATLRMYEQRRMSNKNSAMQLWSAAFPRRTVQRMWSSLTTPGGRSQKRWTRLRNIWQDQRRGEDICSKKWCQKVLLNYLARSTTMFYSELIGALEDDIHDTSSPMERRKMERLWAKGTGSWTSLCRLSTQELAKESIWQRRQGRAVLTIWWSVYTAYIPTACMTYIQSVHKNVRMWMRACGSSLWA